MRDRELRSWQSPLYLSLFTTVVPLKRILLHLLWTAVDAFAAWNLVRIWKARSPATTPRRELTILAW